MSGTGYVPLPAPVTADPGFWQKGIEGLNALRDTQAKQAIAGIYQQATDPATGQVDPAKFNLLISQSPQAAWGAGPAMAEQGRAQAAQGVGTQEQLTAHRARMDSMLGLMNGVLAKGGPIGINDVQNAVNQAHLSPTEAAQVAQDINATAGGDPNYDFTNWVKSHQASNLDAQKQIAARTPNMQFHNIGGRLVPVDMNGQTNPNPGSLITTLSPGEATQIVRVDMGDGTTQQMPLSDAVIKLSTNPAMRILGPTTGGGGGGGGGGAANNPLNMRFAGQEGATNAGGFAAFKTPEAGQAATDALFSKYADSGINTLAGLISRWAPPSENDTPSYIARVAKATGLDPNAPINLKDPAITRKIQQAMAVVEGNKNARVAPAPASPPPAVPTPPPAPPAGPPGVQMGGAPPPPPGGATGTYTGGGIGAALAPGGGANPIVVRGSPLPAGRLSGDVGAMMQGVQLARANPLQQTGGAMVAGPGAPTGNNALAGPSVELLPQPGWGGAVGTYSGGPGPATAAAPAARPAVPAPAPVQLPAATPPAPTIGRSLAPGDAEAQQEAKRGSAQDQVAFRRDLPASQGRIFTAQQALQALKGSATGTGTGWLQAINSVIASYEPSALKGILGSYDPAELATNRDLAEKYLTQIAMANASRIGPGTDAKLAAAFTGNPSTHIQNLAAQDVLKVQIGLDRMNQAMGDDMQTQNVAPQDFASWRQNWARTHDPRAFIMDSIAEDPGRLAAFKESMKNASPQEKAIFRSSLEEAKRMGHVQLNLPGQ